MEIKTLQSQPVLSVRVTTTRVQMGATLGQIYGEVADYAARSEAQLVGPPFARCYSFSDESIDLEAGMPVATPVAGEGRVSASALPGGPAASTMHVGSYDNLSESYTALEAWIREQGREGAGAPWEIYLTDPTTAPEHAWQTEIIWPVR